jgi:hypothetical protein
MAFSEGITNKHLVGKVETHNIETVVKLFSLADKCAQEAEAQSCTERCAEELASPECSKPGNKKNKQKAVAALATEGRNKPPTGRNLGGGSQKPTLVKHGAGEWCEIHRIDWHDLTECQLVKGLVENHQKERGNRRHDGCDGGATGVAGLGFQEP